VQAVAYGIPGNWIGRKPENGGNSTTPMDNIAPNLTSTDKHGVSHNMNVRRLTPRECERLQGFPDNYTQIPYRNKDVADCPDGPRYKAMGNSMAVPVMRWIGERIQMVEEIKIE
jgi:DNA (cytosine-5)-methyltransferase 1